MKLNDSLPCFYAFGGLGLASNFESLISFYSGILLIFVACLIWMRRIEYRQDLTRNVKRGHG